MWRWIAEKTIERKRKVFKEEYFEENDIERVANLCFCCEYSRDFKGGDRACGGCPLDFGDKAIRTRCLDAGSVYRKYQTCGYEDCAALALKIANLPERMLEDEE